MGSPPMSLIPATLSINDGKLCAEITVGPSAAKRVQLALNGFDTSTLDLLIATGSSVLRVCALST